MAPEKPSGCFRRRPFLFRDRRPQLDDHSKDRQAQTGDSATGSGWSSYGDYAGIRLRAAPDRSRVPARVIVRKRCIVASRGRLNARICRKSRRHGLAERTSVDRATCARGHGNQGMPPALEPPLNDALAVIARLVSRRWRPLRRHERKSSECNENARLVKSRGSVTAVNSYVFPFVLLCLNPHSTRTQA